MNPGDAIKNYTIIEPIGQGGSGYTYRVKTGSDLELCLKEHRFGIKTGTEDAFKTRELFLRETNVLKSINHPHIPRYVDSFAEEKNGEERLYLVMEYVEGQNLAQVVKERRINLDYVLDMAKQVVNVLSYLHEFTPPIIHRDIKPENLIEAKDGKIKLVDFGSVADAIVKGTRTTWTSVGTIGFAAPETLYGKATSASDIYSLGCTMIYLLSGGADIAELFLDDNHRLDFRGKLALSKELEQLLWEMTEPNIKRRVQNAEQLRESLYGGNQIKNSVGLQSEPVAAKPNSSILEKKVIEFKAEDGITIRPKYLPLGKIFTKGMLFYRAWDVEAINYGKRRLISQLDTFCSKHNLQLNLSDNPKITFSGVGYDAESEELGVIENRLLSRREQKQLINQVVWPLTIFDGLCDGFIGYFKRLDPLYFNNPEDGHDHINFTNDDFFLTNGDSGMKLFIDASSLTSEYFVDYVELKLFVDKLKI